MILGKVKFCLAPDAPSTAPSTAPAAPPTTSAPAAAPQGTPDTSKAWYGALGDAERGFMEKKNYPDLAAMVKSHQNLESALGAPKERVIRLPEKADAPEWAGIHAQLGKPEKPEGYNIPVAEGVDPGFATWAKGVFHEANLSGKQAEVVAAKWNEYVKTTETSRAETDLAAAHTQFNKLKSEWGAAFEQNKNLANGVADALGLKDADYKAGEKAFGIDGWAKFLHGVTAKLGVTLGEGKFHRGEGSSPTLISSPTAAKAEWDRLSKDPEFGRKVSMNDADTMALVRKLNMEMYPHLLNQDS